MYNNSRKRTDNDLHWSNCWFKRTWRKHLESSNIWCKFDVSFSTNLNMEPGSLCPGWFSGAAASCYHLLIQFCVFYMIYLLQEWVLLKRLMTLKMQKISMRNNKQNNCSFAATIRKLNRESITGAENHCIKGSNLVSSQ